VANLGFATVSVIPSFRGGVGALNNQLGGPMAAVGAAQGQRLGGSMLGALRSSLGPLAALAGAAGLTAFVSTSVRSLQRIERINAQTEVAIRSTGGAAGVTAGHIEDLAGAMENLTASEAESIQQGANLLLTYTNIRNGTGENQQVFDRTTRAMNDMARALDTTGSANLDMSSTATLLGKALNDPIRGLSALQRVGVQFTDSQREMIEGLVEVGDLMGAQGVILEEVERQFGGSAEAFASTTAGRVELAKHAIGTLGETITSGLLPILGTLALNAANALNGMAEAWPGIITRVSQVLAPLRTALEVSLGWIADNRDVVLGAVTGIGVGITTVLVPALWAKVAALWAAAAAWAAANAPMAAALVTLAALGAGAVYAYRNFEPFRALVDGVARSVSGFVSNAREMLPALWGALSDGDAQGVGEVFDNIFGNTGRLVGPVRTLVEFAQTNLPRVRAAAEAAFGWLAVNVPPTLERIRDISVEVWGWYISYLEVVFPRIRDLAIAAFGWLRDNVPPVLSRIRDGAVAAFGWLEDHVPPTLERIRDTSVEVWGWLQANVPPALTAVRTAAVAAFGWLRDNVPPVIARIVTAFQAFREGAETAWGWFIAELWPRLQEVFAGLLQIVRAAIDGIRPIVADMVIWWQENWENIWTTVQRVGLVIGGIIAGIVVAVMWIWDNFGETLVATIVNTVEFITRTLGNAIDIITGIFGVITALISGDWAGAWDNARQIIGAVWDQIRAVVRLGWENIQSLLQLGLDALTALWDLAWEYLPQVASWALDEVMTFIGELPGRVTSAVATLATTLVSWIVDAQTEAPQKLWDFITTIGTWVINHGVPAMLSFGVMMGGKLWDGIVGALDGIGDAMWQIMRGALNMVIDAWNRLDFSIGISVPNWVPEIGGRGFEIDDIFPDIPRLAGGGRIGVGGLAIVGEQGAELVVLPPASAVIPHGTASAFLAGGEAPRTVEHHVTINSTAPVDLDERRLLELLRWEGMLAGAA